MVKDILERIKIKGNFKNILNNFQFQLWRHNSRKYPKLKAPLKPSTLYSYESWYCVDDKNILFGYQNNQKTHWTLTFWLTLIKK